MKIVIKENNILIYISISDTGMVSLEHCSATSQSTAVPEHKKRWFKLVEYHEAGNNQNDHHGSKHTGSNPGSLLTYAAHKDYENEHGRKLEIVQEYEGLFVTSHIQFYHGIQVIKSYTVIENRSDRIHPIEFVSSFALTGIKTEGSCQRDKHSYVHIPHSTWFGEAQWKRYTMNELGYDVVNDFSMKRIHLSNTGSWAASEYLPMGSFEDADHNMTMTWQIETSGSWNWEISDVAGELYLQIYGPNFDQNHFLKKLKPEERFQSVPCAISFVNGDFEDSIKELTKYRRAIRRKNKDNEHPKVIFNDYMNCLMGDPTTEKLLPLIDAAADAGCEYFCIDAGWYDDGYWWDGVGEWLPSKLRFPNGIEEPLQYIRKKGMIPGLWLEIEVMGIHSPMVEKVSNDWFFQRNGCPVIDHSRYQLDFRNREVREYASKVIKRLVDDYGVGYIKMDYNIDAGVGTEWNADSLGDGLLGHTRAYLSWLDEIFTLYPDLIIENCGSGGMRMEYSLLKRHSIQSVTDQTDYLKMAAIAANCMTGITPEQAAIWSYPLKEGDREEVVFNMVNAILMRIHQSGHLAEISKERFDLVKEGLDYHKRICEKTAKGYPFWPLGLASMKDEFLCVGVDCGDKQYLAVWRTEGEQGSITIPLGRKSKGIDSVEVAYPKQLPTTYSFIKEKNELHILLEPKTARIFEIILE